MKTFRHKWEKNEKMHKELQAVWTEDSKKAAQENWEKLIKNLEARRGKFHQANQPKDEEEKEQYFENCYNFLTLS